MYKILKIGKTKITNIENGQHMVGVPKKKKNHPSVPEISSSKAIYSLKNTFNNNELLRGVGSPTTLINTCVFL